MGVVETVKDVVTLVQKADNLELVKHLQSEIMKMMDENRALKEENRELKGQLQVRQTLVFKKNAYWIPKENGSEEGPFCSTCYDGDNKLVRLTESVTPGRFFCKVCQLKTQPDGSGSLPASIRFHCCPRQDVVLISAAESEGFRN